MAAKMVTMSNSVNAKTWREASVKASKGREIYEALRNELNSSNVGQAMKQQIMNNAHLIKTLPIEVAKDVNKFIAKETIKGLRSATVAQELKGKIAQYSKARANLIARTEASKTMTALTEARSRDVGVDWYIWRTANDGNRVRPSHRMMQNVVCRYDDPPAPEALNGEASAGNYNAGNIYNCRCFPRPLISIDTISWPAKVFYNGAIQTITKADFLKLSKMGAVVPRQVWKEEPKQAQQPTPVPAYNETDYVLVHRNDVEQYVQKLWGGFSEEEEKAAYSYVATSNSFDMNRVLYEGTYAEVKSGQKAIDDLRGSDKYNIDRIDALGKLIDKCELPKPMRVVRNVDHNYLSSLCNEIGGEDLKHEFRKVDEVSGQIAFLNKHIATTKYTNKSFISTSYSADENVFKGRDVHIEFYADKGTKALITKNWSESEIVFNKDSRVEILGFEPMEYKGWRGVTKEVIKMKARILK